MRSTMTVLFVIAILISSTQTFRHIYVKWIHPKSSVLDEFKDKTIIKTESSKNINELMISYREVKKAVQNYEEINGKMDHKYSYEKLSIEPYKTEIEIKNEIISREQDQIQLTQLKFYWIAGLLSLLVGLLTLFRFNGWLGFSGIVVGISEMLVWTSPLFFNKSLNQQFVSLLDYKLTLSVATWLIIVALWLIIDKKNLLKRSQK